MPSDQARGAQAGSLRDRLRFAGLPAWLVWRAYYLLRMPTLGRKLRLWVEWTWAMVFPAGGPVPRHPSQLYEAALEGVVLFLILFVLATRFQARRWPGVISGAFLAGYGIARILVEFFREPDPQLGFLWGGATMGQLLSLPMIAVGIGAILYARCRTPA